MADDDLLDREASEPTRIIGSDKDDNETTPMAVTDNQDAHVLDRANEAGASAAVEINNVPKIVNAADTGDVADNLAERKSILIQPLDGVCFVGFSPGSQPHRVARRDVFEFKVGPNIAVYVRKNGGANQTVAVTELS